VYVIGVKNGRPEQAPRPGATTSAYCWNASVRGVYENEPEGAGKLKAKQQTCQWV